ncbi:hypothetical protein PARMER_01009 [Parabacteroides merdae ATCC 43184]|nr:hypothetical protein PARMER_01009 [Parabacteroides merdae ATCC 43184]
MYPLLHRNGTNTGLRYPLTVVRSGPHSGSPMKEKPDNLDCCIFLI